MSPQLRAVVGTFNVPRYLVQCGGTATSGFHYSSSSPSALPTQRPGNVAVASFECIIPSSAGAATPARVPLYGHGLFGSYAEVEDPSVQALAVGHDMVFCGTDWWGLTQADEPLAASVVSDLDRFPVLVDRLQQAVLNTLFLGRLMISPHGLAANAGFQAGGRPVIDTSHLYYDGNSQGGIIGGVVAAVSPDVRADPDGYAPYVVHGLPNTPSHQVLMQIGLRGLPGEHVRRGGRGAVDRCIGLPAGG